MSPSLKTDKLLKIDAHAHVFLESLPMLENRRYTPSYDALPDKYFSLLNAHNMDGALLVQPSFLGTDNSYLVDVLAAAEEKQPDLLIRGVAVLDPSIEMGEMLTLKKKGITGIRLNCLSRELPNFKNQLLIEFLERVNSLGWHVEFQVEGSRVENVLTNLMNTNDRIVIDHFGLPDNENSLINSGLSDLIGSSENNIYVKVSAPYRVFPKLPINQAVAKCETFTHYLIDKIGRNRLIWGSDWPWTQHESTQTYDDCLDWGKDWLNEKNVNEQLCSFAVVPDWLMNP